MSKFLPSLFLAFRDTLFFLYFFSNFGLWLINVFINNGYLTVCVLVVWDNFSMWNTKLELSLFLLRVEETIYLFRCQCRVFIWIFYFLLFSSLTMRSRNSFFFQLCKKIWSISNDFYTFWSIFRRHQGSCQNLPTTIL